MIIHVDFKTFNFLVQQVESKTNREQYNQLVFVWFRMNMHVTQFLAS